MCVREGGREGGREGEKEICTSSQQPLNFIAEILTYASK